MNPDVFSFQLIVNSKILFQLINKFNVKIEKTFNLSKLVEKNGYL